MLLQILFFFFTAKSYFTVYIYSHLFFSLDLEFGPFLEIPGVEAALLSRGRGLEVDY